MEACRRLQFTEGYWLCGTADDPADGGFSVGQLYAVSIYARAGPACYFQGLVKSVLDLFIDYAKPIVGPVKIAVILLHGVRDTIRRPPLRQKRVSLL